MLRFSDVKINLSKCPYLATCVEFVGCQLSERGLQPFKKELRTCQSFSTPTNTTEAHSFSGLVRFNAHLIRNIGDLDEPLIRMKRGYKSQAFLLRPEQEAALEHRQKWLKCA